MAFLPELQRRTSLGKKERDKEVTRILNSFHKKCNAFACGGAQTCMDLQWSNCFTTRRDEYGHARNTDVGLQQEFLEHLQAKLDHGFAGLATAIFQRHGGRNTGIVLEAKLPDPGRKRKRELGGGTTTTLARRRMLVATVLRFRVRLTRKTAAPARRTANLPPGWCGHWKRYKTGKNVGGWYCQYYSEDGMFRYVCSARQAIEKYCSNSGEDKIPMLEEYDLLMREDHKAKHPAKELKDERREDAAKRFEQSFGFQLRGRIAMHLEGWQTRWRYMPTCGQVHMEYIDGDGRSWLLLKDMMAAMQHQVDEGRGGHLPAMLRRAREAGDNPEGEQKFAEGTRKAREREGVWEVSHGAPAGRIVKEEEDSEAHKRDSARYAPVVQTEAPLKLERAPEEPAAPAALPAVAWPQLAQGVDTGGAERPRPAAAHHRSKRRPHLSPRFGDGAAQMVADRRRWLLLKVPRPSPGCWSPRGD